MPDRACRSARLQDAAELHDELVGVDGNAIQRAWMQAADDLRIAVIVSPTVTVHGSTVEALALVTGFGFTSGMLIFGHDYFQAARPHLDDLLDLGFALCAMTPDHYDRDGFIDMLNDWQWNDADRSPPDWYTGQPKP